MSGIKRPVSYGIAGAILACFAATWLTGWVIDVILELAAVSLAIFWFKYVRKWN